MISSNIAILVSVGLFFGLIIMLEAGRRLGRRRSARDPESARAGLSTVEGAVFGLLGLLFAFTFSGAAARFDNRRELIAAEANAIGTAWLRIGVLPENARPPLRELFKSYLDSRLETYAWPPDSERAREETKRSQKFQDEIWNRATAACREANDHSAKVLLLPALNEMFDITTTRAMATQMHPPTIVYVMMVGLALIAALLAGYGMAGAQSRSWTHVVAFAAILSVTVYVIFDLEHPRQGLIRIESADNALRDVRRSMD
jgi:hypothetical protein